INVLFSLNSLTDSIISKNNILKSDTFDVYLKNGKFDNDRLIDVGTKVFALCRKDQRAYFATVIDIIYNDNEIKYKIMYVDNEIATESLDRIMKINVGMEIIMDKYKITLLEELDDSYYLCVSNGLKISMNV